MGKIFAIIVLIYVIFLNMHYANKEIQEYKDELAVIQNIALERNDNYEIVLDDIVREISSFEKRKEAKEK